MKNVLAQDIVFPHALIKRYTKPVDKPNFQKQTFNQAMRGNQNLPKRQVTSNNITGKPLPFPYRSRSNSQDRNNSRHGSPHKYPQNNSKPYYGNSNFKPPSRNGSPYPKPNLYKISTKSRPQSPHNNRDGNRPQRPFSRNRLRNVRNYINALLDQEQPDDTTSHTEKNENQSVSEETLQEQQFNYLILELNQDTHEEYFNCQEECNTLTEEYILSTSCKSNIWVIPLTIYTPQSPNTKRTISPPHLEIDFLLDNGDTLNILNNDTWNEIKEYHQLKLKTSTFVLSAANDSKLQSNGTVKLRLYPDVTESRILRNTSFTVTFHVTNTKFNFLGTPFLHHTYTILGTPYVDSIKCSSHTLEIKDNDEIKPIKFYDSSTKPPPYYSRLFPVIGEQSAYLQPTEHRIITYSLTAYECKHKYANGTLLYASDFSFIPLRKNMFFSIMDINNLEYPYQSFIQILIQNPLSHPLTLTKGLIGYA